MSSIPTTISTHSASSSSPDINLLCSHPFQDNSYNNTIKYQQDNIFRATVNMVAIKSLVVLLPFFLSMAAALPPIPAVSNLTAELSAEAGDISALDGSVNVGFYEDKNPDHSTKIDPNTCKGKAIIALMKWRSNCKTFNAIFRSSCYTHAPSNHNCCPVPHKKSCTHYWPKAGE